MAFGRIEVYEYRCNTPDCEETFRREVFVRAGRNHPIGSAALPGHWREVRAFKDGVVSGHPTHYCGMCVHLGKAPKEDTPEHLKAL